MELTVEALAYLHDADLHGVVFDCNTPNRSVSFTATFHNDCGSPDLNGRSIRVVADDITLLKAEVHGAMAGREEIDSCDLISSEAAERALAPSIKIGLRKPRMSLMLVTHSGSVWEIMCESLAVSFI